MIGAVPKGKNAANTFFDYFATQFRTPEARRGRALMNYRGQDDTTGQNFPIRVLLASHWADREADLRNTAKFLYDIANTALALQGQPVLKFSGIDPTKLEDTPAMPEHGFSIDIARLDGTVAYGFRPTPRGRLPKELVAARCLDFQVTLETDQVQTLAFGADGTVEYFPARRTDLVAYSGTVCLEQDPTLYFRARQTAQHEDFVFGTKAVQTAQKQLGELVSIPYNELVSLGQPVATNSLA